MRTVGFILTPLLATAFLAGPAQARTVNGCEIRPGTNCVGADLNRAFPDRAHLASAHLIHTNPSGERLVCATLSTPGSTRGRARGV